MDVFDYGTDEATATGVLAEYDYHGLGEFVGRHRVGERYSTLTSAGSTDG